MKKHSTGTQTPTWRLSIGLCLLGIGCWSGVACSGGSTGQNPVADGELALLEILNCPQDSLEIGVKLPIQVEGRDAQGRSVAVDSLALQSDQPRYLEAKADGSVQALYPGKVSVTASSQGIQSSTCDFAIAAPKNSGSVNRLSQNDEADDWGMNNNWKMTAEGLVLWQHLTTGGDIEVLLHDREEALSAVTPIETLPSGGEVDFMALGSGEASGEVLASYRVDLSQTKVSDNGAAPQNLGAQQQEENSIADGCFFFREGGGFNDIQRFSIGGGLKEVALLGETYGPIVSQCQAVWETRGPASSELTYFDGTSAQPVDSDLPFFPQYDLRKGRIVYSKGGDVYLADADAASPTITPLTQDGLAALDEFPKTDGESVIWRRTEGAEQHVVLYEIATGRQRTISTTTDPKAFDSLQIDLKQAAWIECSSLPCNSANATLWFHDGSGDSSGTEEVDTGLVPVDPTFKAYLMDGLLTWIGNDGDTEVFFMK